MGCDAVDDMFDNALQDELEAHMIMDAAQEQCLRPDACQRDQVFYNDDGLVECPACGFVTDI